jgi:hypothetical protein
LAVLLAGVGLLAVAIVAVGGFYLFRRGGPLAREPATLREFAELLQARGLDIGWSTDDIKSILIAKRSFYILLADKGSSADEPRKYFLGADGKFAGTNTTLRKVVRGRRSLGLGYFPKGVVGVLQFDTDKQARELAGSTRECFAYGRFLIYGDADLIEEIKRRL